MHPLVWKGPRLRGELREPRVRVEEVEYADPRGPPEGQGSQHEAGPGAYGACGRREGRDAAARTWANKVCPNCGAVGQFTEPMPFKLMFKTQMGANAHDSMVLYLRPETAQGIFANFRNVGRQHPRQGPVRHRRDRQELPQRGNHQGLHLPHPRVRAGGIGVFL